jgi:hypothetical protein
MCMHSGSDLIRCIVADVAGTNELIHSWYIIVGHLYTHSTKYKHTFIKYHHYIVRLIKH